jgi:hypothetical protein
MTETEVQKLRDAGISDAIILEMQSEEASKKGGASPAVQSTSELPTIDPNTPSQVFQQAQAAGVPTTGGEQTWTQTAMELAPAVGSAVATAAPYAAGAAGLYGGGKLVSAAGKAAEAYKTGIATQAGAQMSNAATHAATQEMKVLQQLAQQQGPHAEAAKQRLAQLIQSRGAAIPTGGVPAGPAVPSAVPTTAPVSAAPQQPGIVQRGMDVASKMRQFAAERVIPAAKSGIEAVAPYLRNAGVGAAAALTPGNIGQNYGAQFPQSGPMRGMEINPNTGRPWSPQELAAYSQQFGG